MACCKRTVGPYNPGCCGETCPPQGMGECSMSHCPPSICCTLFKTMLDPCSKMLERNVRRNVYGQVRLRPPCPPLRPWCCGVKSEASPCCPASRVSKNMSTSYSSGGCCSGSSGNSCPPPPSDSCEARKPVVVSFKCPTTSYPMACDPPVSGCFKCPLPLTQKCRLGKYGAPGI